MSWSSPKWSRTCLSPNRRTSATTCRKPTLSSSPRTSRSSTTTTASTVDRSGDDALQRELGAVGGEAVEPVGALEESEDRAVGALEDPHSGRVRELVGRRPIRAAGDRVARRRQLDRCAELMLE